MDLSTVGFFEGKIKEIEAENVSEIKNTKINKLKEVNLETDRIVDDLVPTGGAETDTESDSVFWSDSDSPKESETESKGKKANSEVPLQRTSDGSKDK